MLTCTRSRNISSRLAYPAAILWAAQLGLVAGVFLERPGLYKDWCYAWYLEDGSSEKQWCYTMDEPGKYAVDPCDRFDGMPKEEGCYKPLETKAEDVPNVVPLDAGHGWQCNRKWHVDSPPKELEEAKNWTMGHNVFRCMHGAPFVQWWSAVADDMRDFVLHLKTLRTSDPSERGGLAGENMFTGGGSSFPYLEPGDAVSNWYLEVEECSSWPGCVEETGSHTAEHFAAVVWRGVKYIGCASNQHNFFGCRYRAEDAVEMDCRVPNSWATDKCYEQNILEATRSLDECKAMVQECFDVAPARMEQFYEGNTTRDYNNSCPTTMSQDFYRLFFDERCLAAMDEGEHIGCPVTAADEYIHALTKELKLLNVIAAPFLFVGFVCLSLVGKIPDPKKGEGEEEEAAAVPAAAAAARDEKTPLKSDVAPAPTRAAGTVGAASKDEETGTVAEPAPIARAAKRKKWNWGKICFWIWVVWQIATCTFYGLSVLVFFLGFMNMHHHLGPCYVQEHKAWDVSVISMTIWPLALFQMTVIQKIAPLVITVYITVTSYKSSFERNVETPEGQSGDNNNVTDIVVHPLVRWMIYLVILIIGVTLAMHILCGGIFVTLLFFSPFFLVPGFLLAMALFLLNYLDIDRTTDWDEQGIPVLWLIYTELREEWERRSLFVLVLILVFWLIVAPAVFLGQVSILHAWTGDSFFKSLWASVCSTYARFFFHIQIYWPSLADLPAFFAGLPRLCEHWAETMNEVAGDFPNSVLENLEGLYLKVPPAELLLAGTAVGVLSEMLNSVRAFIFVINAFLIYMGTKHIPVIEAGKIQKRLEHMRPWYSEDDATELIRRMKGGLTKGIVKKLEQAFKKPWDQDIAVAHSQEIADILIKDEKDSLEKLRPKAAVDRKKHVGLKLLAGMCEAANLHFDLGPGDLEAFLLREGRWEKGFDKYKRCGPVCLNSLSLVSAMWKHNVSPDTLKEKRQTLRRHELWGRDPGELPEAAKAVQAKIIQVWKEMEGEKDLKDDVGRLTEKDMNSLKALGAEGHDVLKSMVEQWETNDLKSAGVDCIAPYVALAINMGAEKKKECAVILRGIFQKAPPELKDGARKGLEQLQEELPADGKGLDHLVQMLESGDIRQQLEALEALNNPDVAGKDKATKDRANAVLKNFMSARRMEDRVNELAIKAKKAMDELNTTGTADELHTTTGSAGLMDTVGTHGDASRSAATPRTLRVLSTQDLEDLEARAARPPEEEEEQEQPRDQEKKPTWTSLIRSPRRSSKEDRSKSPGEAATSPCSIL